jgi:pimeloyl-ACP methyl ester carboxylesterase
VKIKTERPYRESSTTSSDGTNISFLSVGDGPGLLVVGGVLSDASDYLALASCLADEFEVHVVNRRGRRPTGPMRAEHSMDTECDDVLAVARATGATLVFGHSFGGLVVLETARRSAIWSRLCLYEPGVPLRGALDPDWLEGYAARLHLGDRRGAFAWMVKHNGFAPRALAAMPMPLLEMVLRLGLRGEHWNKLDRLLDENLIELTIQRGLDAPNAKRFADINARAVLLGGEKSPSVISDLLLHELASVIPEATARILPGLDHAAPERHPDALAPAIRAAV